MVVLEHDRFLTQLQSMYQGTRKWGTVRLQIKRSFQENFHYKKCKRAERSKDQDLQSKVQDAKFALSVKAATPKLRLSCVV